MQDLLPFALVFSILYTHQATLTGIISAAGKQAVAAPLIVVSYWVIGVPLGISLAFGKFSNHRGLHGLWIGMVVGVTCHVLSFAVVVMKINWEVVAKEVQARTQ